MTYEEYLERDKDMTKEEFIEKAQTEDWDEAYLNSMLAVVDSSIKKGMAIPYEIILPPPPLPIAYH